MHSIVTDNVELKKNNPPVSVIAIFMKDLKDMLEGFIRN